MVSGSPLGHIAIWNLDEKRLQSQMRDAHAGPITGMRCLEQEPVMLTSSVDNSIKVFYLLYLNTIQYNRKLMMPHFSSEVHYEARQQET